MRVHQGGGLAGGPSESCPPQGPAIGTSVRAEAGSRDRQHGFRSQLQRPGCAWPVAHSLSQPVSSFVSWEQQRPVKPTVCAVSDRLMCFSLPSCQRPSLVFTGVRMALPLLPPHPPPFWLQPRLFKEHELTGLGSWSPHFGRLDQTWHRRKKCQWKKYLSKNVCMWESVYPIAA